MARNANDRYDDPGYCLFGAKSLLAQVQAFAQEEKGVRRAEDIEYVHRMRVATRRIRATLPLFDGCFPRRDAKAWRRAIKNITRALGEARDADVQIDFLQSCVSGMAGEESPGYKGEGLFLLEGGSIENSPAVPLARAGDRPEEQKSAKRRPDTLGWRSSGPAARERAVALPAATLQQQPLRTGIECLLLRLQQKRERLQPAVAAALDEISGERVVEEMQGACRRLIVEARVHHTDVHTLPAYQRSFFYISLRLEDLFAFEPFVSMEDQIREHHAMRIAAKRLRYTMEIFNDLYGDGLKGAIKAIKKLQDLLGDMHDCDVWIEFLPRFLEEEKERTIGYFGHAGFCRLIEPGIMHLRDDRIRQRSELYREFAAYWKELAQKGVWDDLRAVISMPLQSAAEGTLAHLAEAAEGGPVHLALIGDVHANLPALEAVIDDARSRGASAIIHTGDAVGYGAEPNQVLRLMRDRHVIGVAGNYDQAVLESGKKKKQTKKKKKDGLGVKRWTYKQLSRENRAYLSSLPREVRLTLARKRILVTHGSPTSITEYIDGGTPEERLRELARRARADIVVTGHAHRPFAREVDGVWFINTGSVGRPDDGDPRACYALLQLNTISVCHFRIPYNLDAEVSAVLEAGLPRVVAEMIRLGLAQDAVEKTRSGEADENAKKILYRDSGYRGEER
jgi:putative phosphoesterase